MLKLCKIKYQDDRLDEKCRKNTHFLVLYSRKLVKTVHFFARKWYNT